MTAVEFHATLAASAPPPNLTPVLLALWHDGKGDWDTAHRVAQDIAGADGAWVHAYLHRKEGDEGNAAYWYHRAQQPVARGPFPEEWRALVTAFLRG